MSNSFYRRRLWPVLSRLDAETAHELALVALAAAERWPPGRALLRRVAGAVPGREVEAAGLTFPNLLGVAAGFDKDVRVARGLGELGFGHVEVGTLTPRPQLGNPPPRLFRLEASGAVINRLGFPNGGVAAALPHLEALAALPRRWRLGVSLGKQKETPLAAAVEDYLRVQAAVYPYADYLAVNVSSPNTPGLRRLQGGEPLRSLLGELVAAGAAARRRHGGPLRPLWVKLAPDLGDAELDETLEAVTGAGAHGIIATNTTLRREGVAGALAAEAGGLSGRPLLPLATAMVARIRRRVGAELPIVGVGGVATAADVEAMVDAGATLVQLYTALIYAGPGLAGRLLRQLAAAQGAPEPEP